MPLPQGLPPPIGALGACMGMGIPGAPNPYGAAGLVRQPQLPPLSVPMPGGFAGQAAFRGACGGAATPAAAPPPMPMPVPPMPTSDPMTSSSSLLPGTGNWAPGPTPEQLAAARPLVAAAAAAAPAVAADNAAGARQRGGGSTSARKKLTRRGARQAPAPAPVPLLQLSNLGKTAAGQPSATPPRAPLESTAASAAPPLELDWPGLSDESDTDGGGGTPLQGRKAAAMLGHGRATGGQHEVVDLANLGDLRL
jgi:hypothetical protein